MTMKEGVGGDPFTDDSEPADDSSTETDTEDKTRSNEPSQTDTQKSSQQQAMQIPYKFRRDGVKDGRDRVPLFLQEETKRSEREVHRELEERFDDDISLTDIREAVLRAGFENLDDAETHLEEWGYGMSFEG